MLAHLYVQIDPELKEAARKGDWEKIQAYIDTVLADPKTSTPENLLVIRGRMTQLYLIAKYHEQTKVMDQCLRIPEVKENVVTGSLLSTGPSKL